MSAGICYRAVWRTVSLLPHPRVILSGRRRGMIEGSSVANQQTIRCKFTAEHGKKIGWKPRYAPEHILEDADAEVELILNNS